ncbi:phage tail sheath family protein, partial [Arthrospira platensis SPKY2]
METAVPAFVGYTEKALGTDQSDLSDKPVKIRSLADFESLFGKAFEPEEFNVTVDTAQENAIESIIPDKRFFLYDSLRQFYDNGGGVCYIVSVG